MGKVIYAAHRFNKKPQLTTTTKVAELLAKLKEARENERPT